MAQSVEPRGISSIWTGIIAVAVLAAAAFYIARGWSGRSAELPARVGRTPEIPWRGLSVAKPEAYRGYTLLAPIRSKKTYLLDMAGKVVHTWEARGNPALSAYLLESGHLFRPAANPDQPFVGSGAGGRIQEFDWNGRMVWDFAYSTETRRPHHDAIKLPNGNVLMIAWDRKSPREAVAAGRRPESLDARPLQADCLVEVKPTGPTSGAVVWEWRVWDHLIQDVDATKANYGNVAQHLELVDLNFDRGVMAALLRSSDSLKKLRSIGYIGGGEAGKVLNPVEPDWTHFNGIDYNAGLDQIVITVLAFNEFWVIDHGTTTAEAASHAGGRAGKGGDLLYRWGNPLAYRVASATADTKLFQPHSAHWIPTGLPGAGHFLVFNNGMRRPDGEYSSVEEIVPPVDPAGRYSRVKGKPFGPDSPVWSYSAPIKADFYSALMSGAQRLSNGNTLICSGNNGTLFEVTPAGEVVWKYVNPFDEHSGDRPAVAAGRFAGWSHNRSLGEQASPGGSDKTSTPSEVLPAVVRDALGLKPSQREQLDAFQTKADAALAALLSDDQMKRLRERRGPGAYSLPGKLMAVATKVTLLLTPDQDTMLEALQTRVDEQLDSLLTTEQLTRLKQLRADITRGMSTHVIGIPPGPGGPLGGPPGGEPVFRAYRYGPDYAGLVGKHLTPGKTVEESQSNEDTHGR